MTPSEPRKTRSACAGCRWAYPSINGLYCPRLRVYVEYKAQQPCINIFNNP